MLLLPESIAPARGSHLDAVVPVDDAQHVEQLPLVLVNALYLHVEHRLRAHLRKWCRQYFTGCVAEMKAKKTSGQRVY